MVPCLVPTSIALSQVTPAVPGLSWDYLTPSTPMAEYPKSQDCQCYSGVQKYSATGVLGVGESQDNPRTVTPVFWDTSNLGWVSLSKDNPRTAGVTLPCQRYLVQHHWNCVPSPDTKRSAQACSIIMYQPPPFFSNPRSAPRLSSNLGGR